MPDAPAFSGTMWDKPQKKCYPNPCSYELSPLRATWYRSCCLGVQVGPIIVTPGRNEH